MTGCLPEPSRQPGLHLRRRAVDSFDAHFPQELHELCRLETVALRHYAKGSTRENLYPLLNRCVEVERRIHGDTRARPCFGVKLLKPAPEIEHLPVLDLHRLRFSRGAGRIDDVCQVPRIEVATVRIIPGVTGSDLFPIAIKSDHANRIRWQLRYEAF